MKTKELLENINALSKSYFQVSDFEKLYRGSQGSLKVVLSRLVEQGKIIRLIHGYYTLKQATVDMEALACELIRPSYISLESALSTYGIIDQVPASITLVTLKKTRQLAVLNHTLEYAHFSEKYYFGYRIEGSMLIAEKEKAVLDMLYLMSLGRRLFSIESLDFTGFQRRLFQKWLKRFPPRTQRLARRLTI